MTLKATGFVVYEYDDNEELLITFIYPAADKDLKTVIIETGTFLVNSNQTSLYSSFGSKYLYFENKRNTDRSGSARIFGICIMADNLYPAYYSEFGKVLVEIFHDSSNAPKVLRQYLSSLTDGQLEYKDLQFSIDNFEDDPFQKLNFSPLLDRISPRQVAFIWQALITGKTIGVYSADIVVLQQCALAIVALCCPGTRPVLPFVIESSSTMTNAAEDTKQVIWCSCDASIISKRFDLLINLTANTVTPSAAFEKELTSDMLEHVAESISDAHETTASVYEAIVDLNNQIVIPLQKVQEKKGDLSPASIASLNLPSETKSLLTGIAVAQVLPIP